MNQTRVIFDRNGKVCRPNAKESARLPECGVFDRPFVPQNRGDAPVKPATAKPRVTGEITPSTVVNELEFDGPIEGGAVRTRLIFCLVDSMHPQQKLLMWSL